MRNAAGHGCWKCGGDLVAVPLPMPREATCPACRAWLHACRQCQFYEPRLTAKCREERAEEVRDKEGANFCDWFKPNPGAHTKGSGNKMAAAKSKLDELFGGKEST